MHPFFDSVLDYLYLNNPAQHSLLLQKISGKPDDYFNQVEESLAGLNTFLTSAGKSFEFGLECYNKKLLDIFEEYLFLVRNGRYKYSSFAEVEERVYGNPGIMEYHTIGLMFLEIINYENYLKLEFFRKALVRYKNTVRTYFEIGGGHGMYTAGAHRILGESAEYFFLDISATSLNIAKQFLSDLQVNFIQNDILLYETNKRFDFITLGSVLEHVEEPPRLLGKIRELLSEKGMFCITVPINDPAIDHIYLFNDVDEIKSMIDSTGFVPVDEIVVTQNNQSIEKCYKNRLSVYYTGLLKQK